MLQCTMCDVTATACVTFSQKTMHRNVSMLECDNGGKIATPPPPLLILPFLHKKDDNVQCSLAQMAQSKGNVKNSKPNKKKMIC